MWETCLNGTFSSVGAGSCISCAAGSYSNTAGGASECTTCDAGKFCSDQAVEMVDCPAGKYSNNGAGACISCAAGSYSNTTGGASECTTCDPGTACVDEATEMSVCPPGFFSGAGSASCQICPKGTHSSSEGAAACVACNAGKYCNEGADAMLPCPPGKFSNNGASSCTDCPAGTFSDSLDGPTECLTCAAGKYCPAKATAESSCESGTFSNLGAGTCTQCGPASIAPETSSPSCLSCNANLVANENNTECVSQPGFYKSPTADEAISVPEGVSANSSAMTLYTLELLEGYYRTTSNSTQILPCLNEAHCAGGSDPSSYCADGHEGPLCAVCASGFAAIGAGEAMACYECTANTSAFVIIGIVAMILVILVPCYIMFKRKRSKGEELELEVEGNEEREETTEPPPLTRRKKAALKDAAAERLKKAKPITKIVFAYFQVVGGLGSLFGIEFPPYYKKVTSFLGGLVSLDFISILPLGCMAPTDFYNALLVYTLLPILISAVLIGYYIFLSRRSDDKAISRRIKVFETFLVLTFLVLPTVSVKIFSTFACHAFDNGRSFLKVDYSIDCQAPQHSQFVQFASLMVLVYPIGIPAMYYYLLWKKKALLDPGQEEKEHRMSDEDALRETLKEREELEEKYPDMKSLRFLYESYEPKYWWFELFETMRKLTLTGFLVFLAPGTAAQVLFSLIMCINAMRVYAGCQPFIDLSNDRISEVAQWQLLYTLIAALAIKVNLDGENLNDMVFFDVMLTSVNVFPLLLALVLAPLEEGVTNVDDKDEREVGDGDEVGDGGEVGELKKDKEIELKEVAPADRGKVLPLM